MTIQATDGLKHSGIPLGGLGTGTVEIRNDGLFHEWQIMNNAPWGPGAGASIPADALFFGLQVHGEDTYQSAQLSTAPAPLRTLNDGYAMPWLEHAASIDSTAKFPFTELAFNYDSLPVDVQLEAFSPFIPLDSKNSGLPVAFMTYSLKNRSENPQTVTLFGCQRNLVGYTSQQSLSTIEANTEAKKPYLAFSREGLPTTNSDAGSMAFGMITGSAGKTTYATHFRPRDLWDPMLETGLLENVDQGALDEDEGNMGDSQRVNRRRGLPYGALAHTVTLKPGEATDITFVLSWYFPNFIEPEYKPKSVPGSNIGHRYEEWFTDATDVFKYATKNFDKLRDETRLFFDAYYDSSQPAWLLDAVSAQLTTMTKASWWDRDGRFGIWEGLGCCGLQTTDITHYGSFPIAQFFPDIQKSQMRLSRDNVETPGNIPHMMPGTFACCDIDHRKRIDLIPQFILLVWRDLMWTGDREYLKEMWQTIKDSLAHFETKDTDGDGLPNNTGPDQTYDQFPLKGTSAFVGILYLASLKVAADMAVLMEDDAYEDELRVQFDRAYPLLHDQLWNGEYFRLCHDPVDGESHEGVMADQLNGDWFIRQTTGESLIDDTKVKSSLKSILDACLEPSGYLANCAWPNGGSVEIGRHTADQANWPWSGVEYAVAAHLILMGMDEEGINLTKCVWERYERMGMRFNHIECGGHYYRAMSSWAVYLALSGYVVDLLNNTLKIRFRETPMNSVLAAPTGWGCLVVDKESRLVTLEMARGKLKLKQVELTGIQTGDAIIRVNSKVVSTTTLEGVVTLNKVAALRKDDVLVVSLK
jgi:uncharacterized protein (DUF608 family)